MAEVDERLNSLLDHGMSRPARDARDECHAAGIVFDGRVEQTSIRGLST